MRRSTRTAAAAVVLMGLGIALVGTSGAGNGQNTFTVEKVVEGPVPDGAVFEVVVTCEEPNIEAAPAGSATPVTIRFDADGNPLDPNTVMAPFFGTCNAVETVDNGATVSYACATTDPVPDGAAPDADVPYVPVQCLDDQTVDYNDISGATGTVTVTNTFEEEPPPAVAPAAAAPAAAAPAGVVAARPAFTG